MYKLLLNVGMLNLVSFDLYIDLLKTKAINLILCFV